MYHLELLLSVYLCATDISSTSQNLLTPLGNENIICNKNNKSVLTSFGIETIDDELDLSYIYWISKMHKTPYTHRFIAGSSKCSTEPLSTLLTKLHIYSAMSSEVLRNSLLKKWDQTDVGEFKGDIGTYLISNFQPCYNVQASSLLDFWTLYTTIPRQKLKNRLTSIIWNAFIKNGNRIYKYLVFWQEETYFVKAHSDSKSKYSEDDIIKMLKILVDNIFMVLPEMSSNRQLAFH